jgi:ubiquinone/menaquinone biosynthesis C-methylase UbiE
MEYDQNKIQVKTIHGAVDFRQKHVLEIGCGDGKTSVHLAWGTKAYTAIDPDQKSIDLAKGLNRKPLFKIGSGQALEFDAESFDIVLFTLSLHHQDSQAALKEAFRILIPGGSLLVLEPLATGEFQQFFHLFDDETPDLDAAVSAILTSKFGLVKRGAFHVSACFKDTQDFLSYDFGRNKIRPGDDKKILDLLCRLKADSSTDPVHSSKRHPDGTIRLKDELQLFLLKKNA